MPSEWSEHERLKVAALLLREFPELSINKLLAAVSDCDADVKPSAGWQRLADCTSAHLLKHGGSGENNPEWVSAGNGCAAQLTVTAPWRQPNGADRTANECRSKSMRSATPAYTGAKVAKKAGASRVEGKRAVKKAKKQTGTVSRPQVEKRAEEIAS